MDGTWPTRRALRTFCLLVLGLLAQSDAKAMDPFVEEWGAAAYTPTVVETAERTMASPPPMAGTMELTRPDGSEPGHLRTDDGRLFVVYEQEPEKEAKKSPKSSASAEAMGGQSGSQAGGGGQAGGEEGQADNGTNPAQNSRTVILSDEFYHLDGGNEINTTYLRLKFPILEREGAFIAELPFVFYDLVSPIEGEVGGIGDIKFQFNLNLLTSADKKLTLLSLIEFYIPSADNILLTQIPDVNEFTALDLGTGKYMLGPGLGLVYAVQPNFIIAPLYIYERSVAGIDARPDIDRGKLRFFMMYAWQSGLYVLPEAQLVSNFITGDQDAYVAPEVGYSTKGTTLYVKPGVGISPDPGNREWGIEFGARIQF